MNVEVGVEVFVGKGVGDGLGVNVAVGGTVFVNVKVGVSNKFLTSEHLLMDMTKIIITRIIPIKGRIFLRVITFIILSVGFNINFRPSVHYSKIIKNLQGLIFGIFSLNKFGEALNRL